MHIGFGANCNQDKKSNGIITAAVKNWRHRIMNLLILCTPLKKYKSNVQTPYQ